MREGGIWIIIFKFFWNLFICLCRKGHLLSRIVQILSYFRVAYDKKQAKHSLALHSHLYCIWARTAAGLAEKRNKCSFLVSLKESSTSVFCYMHYLTAVTWRWCQGHNVSVSREAKMTTETMKETFYIAPEVIRSGFYDSKADIYSFCTMP